MYMKRGNVHYLVLRHVNATELSKMSNFMGGPSTRCYLATVIRLCQNYRVEIKIKVQ